MKDRQEPRALGRWVDGFVVPPGHPVGDRYALERGLAHRTTEPVAGAGRPIDEATAARLGLPRVASG